jgi:hypothetical protein
MTMSFAGKVDGDKIFGEVELGPIGRGSFTATRAHSAAA